jgi:hypothetical protein
VFGVLICEFGQISGNWLFGNLLIENHTLGGLPGDKFLIFQLLTLLMFYLFSGFISAIIAKKSSLIHVMIVAFITLIFLYAYSLSTNSIQIWYYPVRTIILVIGLIGGLFIATKIKPKKLELNK